MSIEHSPEGFQPATARASSSKLKDKLFAAWEKFPSDYRATIVLELLASIMVTEHGPWLKETLASRWLKEADPAERTFPVRSISWADLQWVEFSEEEIAQLSDYDMRRIALLLGSDTDAFWNELIFFTRKVLDEKRET